TCLLFTDPTTTPIYPLSLHDALPIFLHPCRVEHGHHCVDQREFALVRNGGRFRGMIIAQQDEHAAQPGRPRGVAVTESIARTVDVGPLSAPDAEEIVIDAPVRHLLLSCYPGCLSGP